MGIETIIK